jgi:hypothetical protein
MGHHFVPQQYMRNFEDPNRRGFIWLHDKQGGDPRSVPITKVAQAKGFYSKETEAILANVVEKPANAVMKKLITEVGITQDERLQLAYYIGVMVKRIPARRRLSTAMIPGVLAKVISRVQEQLISVAKEQNADPEVLRRLLKEVAAAEKKLTTNTPPEVLKQIQDPWPSERIVLAVFNMIWRILVSSGPQYFLTTDNPAFFFNAFGLGKEKSELSFPLSSNYALHGSYQAAPSKLVFVRPTQNIVKEINRRLASEAERLAFYHEPAPWLLKVLQKQRPYLSVINWKK